MADGDPRLGHAETRAACTNSCSRKIRSCDLVNRQNVTQVVTPIAMMMLRTPPPVTETRNMANRMPGKATITSTMRMTVKSTQPPRSPAANPSGMPIKHAIATAENPTIKDVRVP